MNSSFITNGKRATFKWIEEAETWSKKNPTLGSVTYNWEGSHKSGVFPEKEEFNPRDLQ